MDSDYSIVRADLDVDRDDIVRFWLTTFERWPEAKYDLFYLGNPRGKGVCWVAREPENRKVVGTIAVFPRRVCINGEVHATGLAGDLGVDGNHRRRGIAETLFARMVDYGRDASFGFLYGSPNERSGRVAARAGFVTIGQAVRMVRVFRSKAYIRRLVPFRPLADVLSAPVDLVMRVLSREGRRRTSPAYVVEHPEVFDQRFDRLWQRVSGHFALLGERTAAFLNWRFMRCTYKLYRVFVLTTRETQDVAGYVVYRQLDDQVHIADVLSVDRKGTLDELLLAFLRYARQLGAATVTLFYFGNDELTHSFRKFGFSRRHDTRSVIAQIEDDSPWAAVVRNQANWYFFEGDNDA